MTPDDPHMTLLVGFAERFDAHGHNTVIRSLQITTEASVLRCTECDQTAEIHSKNHGGWFLPETPLDLGCPAQEKDA